MLRIIIVIPQRVEKEDVASVGGIIVNSIKGLFEVAPQKGSMVDVNVSAHRDATEFSFEIDESKMDKINPYKIMKDIEKENLHIRKFEGEPCDCGCNPSSLFAVCEIKIVKAEFREHKHIH